MFEQGANSVRLSGPILAGQRKFRIMFGTGALLLVVALLMPHGTVREVLELVGVGLQLWGLIPWWYSLSNAKKD